MGCMAEASIETWVYDIIILQGHSEFVRQVAPQRIRPATQLALLFEVKHLAVDITSHLRQI